MELKPRKLKMWQRKIGDYVKAKRLKAKKTQSDLRVSRQTISEIERHEVDFQLSTLLIILEDVKGDISEAFGSSLPKEFRDREDQEFFELLKAVLDSKDEVAIQLARSVLLRFSGKTRQGLE